MKRLHYIVLALCLWVLSPQAWCDDFNPTSPGDPNPAYRLTVMVDPVAGDPTGEGPAKPRHRVVLFTTPEGAVMQTETRNVTYNRNGVEVSYITMNYINAEEHKEYEMVFDMLYPTKTPNKYRYGPGNHNFDFTIDFTKNNPEVISDVELFVKTKNGLWHAVKTEYDPVHGDWRGSEYFDGVNNNLPVNVDAGFVLTSGEPVGTGRAFRAQMDNLTTFAQLAEMITDWHSISWYTYEEGENYSKIRLESQLSDDYVLIHLETLDYEQSLPQLGQKQFAFTAIPHGYFCLYDEFNDDYYEATVINSADRWAYKIRVTRPGKPLTVRRRAPMNGEMSTDEVIAEFTAEQSQLFTQGLELYTGITSLGERADATGLKQMVELLAHFVKEQKNMYARVEETISAKDVFGDYILSDAQRGEFTRQLNQIARQMDSFQSKYALYLDAYSNMLREISMYNMTIMLLSKTTRPSLAHGAGARRGAVVPEEEEQYWKNQAQLANDAVENELNYTGWQIFYETSDVVEPGNENPDQDMMEEIADEQDEVIQQLADMENTVTSQFPSHVQIAGKAVQPRKGLNPDALVSYDPAGFVYEAVSDNRIEGVKATVYYKETIENIFGEMVEHEHRWDASEYDQENPLYTDEQGYYQWFVPQGMWQVRFEKAGYEPARSDWLPVPPPQLEVNIPIVQLSQPEVISAAAYTGYIELAFDKYMEPELLNTDNIFLMAGDQLIPGRVELQDEKTAYGDAGPTFASKLHFIPDERLSGIEQVTLTVSQRVRSYAGVPMRETFSQVFDVEPDQQDIDQAAADTVIELIAAIGEVTLDSEPAILTARNAYDALTEPQQALVTNYPVLVAAEETLAILKNMTFVVNFLDYDGAILKSDTVHLQAAATAPADPSREGYTFAGWDKDYSFVVSDLTVNALYNVNIYRLAYMAEGVEVAYDSLAYGAVVDVTLHDADAPAKTGYTFAGWTPAVTTMPAHDETVTAQYSLNTYTVTFLDYNDSILSTQTVHWGEAAQEPVQPSREGYTFAGWDVPFGNVQSDLTIHAQYSINSYTLTYRVDGETYGEPQSIAYGASITPLADPTREGYTFSGWSEIPATMPAHDVLVTGTFAINSYTVTFLDYNDSILSTQTVHWGEAAQEPIQPSREGYTFAGWDVAFGNVQSDLTIHAQYSINSYTLTYRVDGETYGEPQSIAYGAGITPLADPTREGYTFSGWSEIPATMPAHDVLVTGTFAINSYTVTFLDYNDSILSTQTVHWGEAAQEPVQPSREGYTFAGWDVPFGNVQSDLTIHAQYSINSYTLTYQVDGETYGEPQSIAYGASITPLADPVREGYTFSGWSEIPATMPAHDVLVTGTFTINTYTVTFLDYNDSILSTQTVNWGEAAQEPVLPSREGYTFAGWDAAFGNVQSDLIIHAQYSINRYAVTIIAGRYTRTDSLTYGTDMEQIVAAVEAVIGRQIVMEDSIYTLVGWTPDLAPVTADITYTAVYTAEARQYKITFVNGMDTLWTDSVEYGQMPVYGGEIPTKESDEQYSYSFAGWTPEITIVTGDATYTAVFEEQPLGPGSGIDRQTADEPVLKFIREDKIYILRGGKLYSVQGQLVQ